MSKLRNISQPDITCGLRLNLWGIDASWPLVAEGEPGTSCRLPVDAFITFWPKDAHGYGHIDIGVNTTQTSGYYSTNKPTCLIINCDDPGRLLDDRKDHPGETPQILRIATTPEQDQAMQAVIDQRRRNPGNYNLYGRNCTKFVEDVLRPAGIQGLPDAYKLEELFNFLKTRQALPYAPGFSQYPTAGYT